MQNIRALQTVLPTPQANQTLKPVFFSKTGAGTETAYTPTAGKSFYLMGVVIYDQGAANTSCDLLDTDGTTTIKRYFLIGAAAPTSNIMQVDNSSTPMQVYTNSTPVKFKDGTSATKIALIGWEE